MSTKPAPSAKQARFLHWAARIRFSRPLSRLHGALYRRTRGRFIPRWFGAPVLSLGVRGRRSGKLFHVPLVYSSHSDGWVVVAANGGMERTPQWALNLKAAGSAMAHVRGRAFEVKPRFLEGDEARAVRKEYEKTYPTVVEYERFTTRELPVIVLERVGP